jgi:hypothetical protein
VKQGASQQLRRLHTTIAHRQQREDVAERCRTGSQAGFARGEGSEESLGLVGQQSRDKDEAAVHVGGENLWAPVGKRLTGGVVRIGARSDRRLAWGKGFARVGLGPGQAGWLRADANQSWAPLQWWAGPFSFPPPPLFTGFYKYSNQIKHVTSEKGTSIAPKMSKFDMVEAKIKRNNFPFGEKFKFQMDFEIKIHE